MKTHGKKMSLPLMMMVSLVILPVLFFSCDQAPLFYAIAQEEAPKEPRLQGTVLFASAGGYTYAASSGSGSILSYDNTSNNWTSTASPGGKIRGLAGTNDGTNSYLFALTDSGAVRYRGSSNSWTTINRGDSSGYTLATIYGTNVTTDGTVFVGGFKDSKYAVFYSKLSSGSYSNFTLLNPDIGLLHGAVYSGTNYYLATGKGLYSWDGTTGTSPSPVAGSGKTITGIIALPPTSPTQIAAVSSDGDLFYGSGISFASADKDETFTGAMGHYTDGTNQLLLLGIQGARDTTTHGYREITLDSNGVISSTALRTPGNSQPSTVDNEEKYNSSIGKYPVIAIRQVSTTGDGIIFAATSRYGIMSCRDKKWNFEE
ncbi:hypothetical protein AGMMS49928_21620 [Spirochaetia bacterium]|nr:hypothetical protein AGMMS49928_21620 [Spirochaetia bacterium]